MPKITIREINATSATPLDVSLGTPVAILGTATKGERIQPKLVSTVAEFNEMFGNAEPLDLPYGYIAARELLQIGNRVLFTRLAQATYEKSSLTLSGLDGENPVDILLVEALSPGTDGDNYSITITTSGENYNVSVYYKGVLTGTGSFVKGTDEDIELLTVSGIKISKLAPDGEVAWGEGVAYTGTGTTPVALTDGNDGTENYSTTNVATLLTDIHAILTQLQDTTLYDYGNISIPGLAHVKNGTTYVWHYLADLTCGTTYTASNYSVVEDKVAIIDSSMTTNLSSILSDLGLEGDEDLSNLALFYPWYRGTTVTSVTVRDLPPSIQYFKAFATLQSDGLPCRAVAGPINGAITRVSSMSPQIGVIVSGQLSSQCINTLCYHRNFGYYIEGNSVYAPSAISETYQQLSIRQTINYIKKQLDNLCYRLSYSVNAGITRTQFQGEATALLERLKRDSFIYTYAVTISNSAADIANGVLTATISIFPTPALEEFSIDLRVVNTVANL